MDDGWDQPDGHGDRAGFFDGCEVVVSVHCANPRMAGVSIEGRASAAAFVDGRLTQWISSQNAHGARSTIAGALGLDESQVRVVVPDVGGGFGPKINPSPEDVLVGWVARRIGRPAIWVETRSENLIAQSQGRGQRHDARIGGNRDGRVLAYELDIRADSGAYPRLGSFLPYFTRLMAPGPYAIARVRSRAECTVTNTTPTEAFRGAGRPEATATLERAMDMFAAEVGMDPAEVRRINLLEPFDTPHRTAAGAEYDSGDYRRALDAALEEAGYVELRSEQRRRRSVAHRLALGVGVSSYVEVTGASMTSEFASVQVHPAPDRQAGVVVSVLTGVSPHGQGLHTALAMITSERLGVPIESVSVAHGDTDAVPHGHGTMGSRSLQIGGTAVSAAAEELLDAARGLAAQELEVAPADIVPDPEHAGFRVVDDPARSVPWSTVAERAEASAGNGSRGSSACGPGLSVSGSFGASGNTYPNGCHVAVVEVDLDTGSVNLVRLVAADDAGTIINPMLAEGQRHGGITQGASQALFEAVRWDGDGNPLTAVLADYGIPSAADVPRWDLVDVATPSPMNPLGAKGIGESGTIGATPAVQSAVVDALAHLGVRHLDMPLTPERVWRAANGLSIWDQ
jgi:carbon-monoxide dehydrogenase large subunit